MCFGRYVTRMQKKEKVTQPYVKDVVTGVRKVFLKDGETSMDWKAVCVWPLLYENATYRILGRAGV